MASPDPAVPPGRTRACGRGSGSPRRSGCRGSSGTRRPPLRGLTAHDRRRRAPARRHRPPSSEIHTAPARQLQVPRCRVVTLSGVIVERSMSEGWLSNTYLVADEQGSAAVMIDAGGPVEPLLELIDREGYELSHVLLTHHHHDHVAELDRVI